MRPLSRYFTNRIISQLVKYMSDQLDTTFAALSDPTRRAILARLAMGETSVKELAEPFSISPPSITKHLKVLERAGLITRSRNAQWRPCRLEAAPAFRRFPIGGELPPVLGTKVRQPGPLPE